MESKDARKPDEIYNCHTHTFTHKNVPNGYLPFGIVPIARFKLLRGLLNIGMKNQ